jgi:hypothetical protein
MRSLAGRTDTFAPSDHTPARSSFALDRTTPPQQPQAAGEAGRDGLPDCPGLKRGMNTFEALGVAPAPPPGGVTDFLRRERAIQDYDKVVPAEESRRDQRLHQRSVFAPIGGDKLCEGLVLDGVATWFPCPYVAGGRGHGISDHHGWFRSNSTAPVWRSHRPSLRIERSAHNPLTTLSSPARA